MPQDLLPPLSLLIACTRLTSSLAAPAASPVPAGGSFAHAEALAQVERLRDEAARDPRRAPWSGSYGGVPPWDRVKTERFPVAFERGLALLAAEIAVITTNPDPATFENTIVPYEDSGRHDNRVGTLFGVW